MAFMSSSATRREVTNALARVMHAEARIEALRFATSDLQSHDWGIEWKDHHTAISAALHANLNHEYRHLLFVAQIDGTPKVRKDAARLTAARFENDRRDFLRNGPEALTFDGERFGVETNLTLDCDNPDHEIECDCYDTMAAMDALTRAADNAEQTHRR